MASPSTDSQGTIPSMNTARLFPPRPVSGNALVRAVTAQVLAVARGWHQADAKQIAAQSWERDEFTQAVLRAAMNPTTTANAAALGSTAVGAFVLTLGGQSGAAGLIARSEKLSLGRATSIALPFDDISTNAAWISEGAAIPVASPTLGVVSLGPIRRLALIQVISQTLADYSAESAEVIIGALLRSSAARVLDTTVLGTAAADSTKPAGIRFGIAALTATAGGGLNALVSDVAALFAAITAAGAGVDPVLICTPARAARLRALAPGLSTIAIFTSTQLGETEIIAVDSAAFVSAFGEIEIEASTEATLHFEDVAPQAIGVSGSPTVPMRNLWQQALVGYRLIIRATWALRPPGAVSWLTAATW